MKTRQDFQNSLEEFFKRNQTAEPCILVIFGASGDLTSRKIIPALYNLFRENLLPPEFACIGFARREKTDESFREEMLTATREHSRVKLQDDLKIWNSFSKKIYYHRSEFQKDDGYQSLKSKMHELDKHLGTKGNRVFYLATQPQHFPLIVQKLGENDLLYDRTQSKEPWSRVIIEKPFGEDYTSAAALQSHITKYLDERQIYRIDHYLGKETVQNLLVLRFANPIFASIWNNQFIDNVQITVAEEIGIGTRGNFFEGAGILRDIVQNHMMQLLSLIAMDPPASLSANDIRNEKVKVLQAIAPFPKNHLETACVRGQYGPGYVNGEKVIGYREENDVHENSNVETYAAFALSINTERWKNVPFYMRAGKRLAKRTTEIAISFKNLQENLFDQTSNTIVIRIQPDEGVSFRMNCKVPGLPSTIHPVNMKFLYNSTFGSSPPEAYERLICDCIYADNTLFARDDEVMASWSLLTPVLERWKSEPMGTFPNYQAGTLGPEEANRLLVKSHHKWRIF